MGIEIKQHASEITVVNYYDMDKQLLRVNCETHCRHYSECDKNVLDNASMLQEMASHQFKDLCMSEFSVNNGFFFLLL